MCVQYIRTHEHQQQQHPCHGAKSILKKSRLLPLRPAVAAIQILSFQVRGTDGRLLPECMPHSMASSYTWGILLQEAWKVRFRKNCKRIDLCLWAVKKIMDLDYLLPTASFRISFNSIACSNLETRYFLEILVDDVLHTEFIKKRALLWKLRHNWRWVITIKCSKESHSYFHQFDRVAHLT